MMIDISAQFDMLPLNLISKSLEQVSYFADKNIENPVTQHVIRHDYTHTESVQCTDVNVWKTVSYHRQKKLNKQDCTNFVSKGTPEKIFFCFLN